LAEFSKAGASTEPGSIESRSHQAFSRGQVVFPDGTTRVTVERDPIPRYISHGEGAYLIDVDGRRFLDLNGNFTTLIHGHAFPPVVEAVTRQIRSGACFANPTEQEIELAELLCGRVPRLEQVRFVSTGTEAVMFAIKAARAFTGRSAIAKFEGAYHGAYDWVEVSQAASPQNWGAADKPSSVAHYRGMPQAVLDETVVLPFNDAETTVRRVEEKASSLAAVIVDPMPSRAGLLSPKAEFIDALHTVCRANGILVIADEVLNFRQGFAGASQRYGLEPDLRAIGKIIGGGLPIGAVGGRAEVMAVFDAGTGRPLVPQGGTFSANPISIAAGLAAMRALDEQAFEYLETLGERLRDRINASISKHDAPFCVMGAASLLRIHPKKTAPETYRQAYLSPGESEIMAALGRHFTRNGILFPRAAASCLSTPMECADIDFVADVFEDFLAAGDLPQSASR